MKRSRFSEEQKIISHKLDLISATTSKVIAETQSQLARLQSLKSSLLDAAFKGKL